MTTSDDLRTGTRPPGTTPFPRDLAATVLVLAVAAFAWFGWSGAAAPSWWPAVAVPGSVLALVTAVVAGLQVRRERATGTVMAEPGANRRYGRWVGLEVVAILVGCLVLARTGLPDLIPAWVLAVVGAHFLPLGDLFRVRLLRTCGVVLVGVAVAAAVLDVLDVTAASTVAGGAGGAVLVLTALVCLRGRR